MDARNPSRTTFGTVEIITFVGMCRGIESFQGVFGGDRFGLRPSTVSQSGDRFGTPGKWLVSLVKSPATRLTNHLLSTMPLSRQDCPDRIHTEPSQSNCFTRRSSSNKQKSDGSIEPNPLRNPPSFWQTTSRRRICFWTTCYFRVRSGRAYLEVHASDK